VRAAGLVALACIAVLAVSAAASATRSPARPAPHLASPTAAAKPLLTRFFDLLAHKDRAGLQAFLAPGFQVQRADGSGSGKAEYLASLPTIDTFSLTKLAATETNGTLVVRYLAVVTGLVNGKPYTPGPAPRLSVFSWNGARWQLTAHANFNPLTG
jgi:hypothetical protein